MHAHRLIAHVAELPNPANPAQQIAQLVGDLARCQAALLTTQRELVRTQANQWRARHLSLHDGLTALPNRSFFQQRMAQALLEPQVAQALARQRSTGEAAPSPAVLAPGAPSQAVVLAVLVLDLDGFKRINDRHGHAAGDALLRIVAARLVRAVRGQDMVCRLGGDEFACLLANLPGPVQLGHLACKLIDTVAAPIAIAPTLQVSVRPSIGIAQCPSDGHNTDLLLRHADAAMFRAKRGQLGHAFFDAGCDV